MLIRVKIKEIRICIRIKNPRKTSIHDFFDNIMSLGFHPWK